MIRRNTKIAGALLALIFLGLWRHLGSLKDTPPTAFAREVKLDFTNEQVWVFEENIHDEVNGAIGVSLQAANVIPTFACHFRHGFSAILSAIMREEPTVLRPNGPTLPDALAADSIEKLILTTCSDSLKRHYKAIHASTANVVCLIHHSNPTVYRELKPLMEPLAAQGRLSILVLGEHVRSRIQLDIYDWIEKMESPIWEGVSVEVTIPVFDYPGLAVRPESAVFPSKAIVQGNIEHGRRNYDKLLLDLKNSMLKSPSTWGYSGFEGSPLRPMKGGSPFTLHLVGQVNPEHVVIVPTELRDVVQIHQNLPYPQFYQFITKARGSYEDTTSSSIAAAVITRLPVLASERHVAACTYLEGPSVIHKTIASSEVSAIEALRKSVKPMKRAGGAEWTRLQNEIIQQNAAVWARLLRHRDRE